MNQKTQSAVEIVKINSETELPQEPKKQPKPHSLLGPFMTEQKEIGILIYIFFCVASLLNGFQTLYVFEPEGQVHKINVAFISTSSVRILFFIVVGIKSAGIKKFLVYLFVFDPITFPMCLAAYAYVFFLHHFFENDTMDYVAIVLLCLQFLTFGGLNRALVGELKWRQWQTFFYKIILFASASFYVAHGMRYLYPGVDWSTDDDDDDLNDAIKEVMIVYIIGSADFVVKLYEKICDLDKSAEVKLEGKLWGNTYFLNE